MHEFWKINVLLSQKFPNAKKKGKGRSNRKKFVVVQEEDTIFKLEIKSRVKGITKMKGNIGVEVCGTV